MTLTGSTFRFFVKNQHLIQTVRSSIFQSPAALPRRFPGLWPPAGSFLVPLCNFLLSKSKTWSCICVFKKFDIYLDCFVCWQKQRFLKFSFIIWTCFDQCHSGWFYLKLEFWGAEMRFVNLYILQHVKVMKLSKSDPNIIQNCARNLEKFTVIARFCS